MGDEVLRSMAPRPGGVYVDCTLGGAGHAGAICERILPGGLLIGLDQDLEAVLNAEAVLAPLGENVKVFRANFVSLPEILSELGIGSVDGILMDLGLSSHQIRNSGRGFGFDRDEPLDMRMDTRTRRTAGDLVNSLSEGELASLFREYGEERYAKAIAGRIIRERAGGEIRTARRLSELVRRAVPRKAWASGRIHPATRVFMALRIAVNRELDRLGWFMEHVVAKDGAAILNRGGRLCVLSFHSLEDRIVKHQIRALEKGCSCPPEFPKCICGGNTSLRRLNRKPLRPTSAEISRNPLARSAKLRVAEKITAPPAGRRDPSEA